MASENFFGRRIFSLRKAAGMTQKQLGESVGLSMQAINDIEKGRRETTITKAILLARTFNTTVHYLVGDTDNPDRSSKPDLVEAMFADDSTLPFAVRLKELQAEKGVSWEEIAKFLENAASKPEINVLIALADYFDVSLDYLVGRSDDPARR